MSAGHRDPEAGAVTGVPAAALRPLCPADWPAVRAVYAAGIATGHATFASEPPSGWAEFDAGRLADHRLVAVEPGDGALLGWVALSGVSDRCVYAGVAEVSVYVAEAARGRGVGRLLLEAALGSAHGGGIWTVQAGVFPENEASLALHRAAGFRVVGVRERLGLMRHGPLAEQWRDVVLLEHRAR